MGGPPRAAVEPSAHLRVLVDATALRDRSDHLAARARRVKFWLRWRCMRLPIDSPFSGGRVRPTKSSCRVACSCGRKRHGKRMIDPSIGARQHDPDAPDMLRPRVWSATNSSTRRRPEAESAKEMPLCILSDPYGTVRNENSDGAERLGSAARMPSTDILPGRTTLMSAWRKVSPKGDSATKFINFFSKSSYEDDIVSFLNTCSYTCLKASFPGQSRRISELIAILSMASDFKLF